MSLSEIYARFIRYLNEYFLNPDLFTERKVTKKLKKLPQLSDATDKVEAAAHKDTEAVHIINDDYSGIVGVVIGTIIGVSLIIALVSSQDIQLDKPFIC